MSAQIQGPDLQTGACGCTGCADCLPTFTYHADGTYSVAHEYGTVTIGAAYVSITAGMSQLSDWARRPGMSWPCSTLADIDAISASFDAGGLVDLATRAGEEHAYSGLFPDDAPDDLGGDELSAWSSDVLRDVLPREHPAWFVAVGQFEEDR